MVDTICISETPNHDYHTPAEGEQNWHIPPNENFQSLDRDIQVWTTQDAKSDYEPAERAGLFTVDTDMVYQGTGDGWDLMYGVGMHDPEGGEFIFSEHIKIEGDIEASGTRNFVQAVETDTGSREVVYTATEAATPRTETPGIAELDDGHAVVDLPEHFGWVTSETESLLIQTAPYAVESSGLAAVERSTDRIVVEDRSGEGDYEFVYTVRGTRHGSEDEAVVHQPQQARSDGSSPATTDD